MRVRWCFSLRCTFWYPFFLLVSAQSEDLCSAALHEFLSSVSLFNWRYLWKIWACAIRYMYSIHVEHSYSVFPSTKSSRRVMHPRVSQQAQRHGVFPILTTSPPPSMISWTTCHRSPCPRSTSIMVRASNMWSDRVLSYCIACLGLIYVVGSRDNA